MCLKRKFPYDIFISRLCLFKARRNSVGLLTRLLLDEWGRCIHVDSNFHGSLPGGGRLLFVRSASISAGVFALEAEAQFTHLPGIERCADDSVSRETRGAS